MRALALALLCLAPIAQAAPLNFLGKVSLPADIRIDKTRVGGLSSIDYDAATGSIVAISDDKSEFGPSRFYTGSVSWSRSDGLKVQLTHAVPFTDAQGKTFAPRGQGREAADGEAMRRIPGSPDLVWSTEGDAKDGFGPSIRRITPDGRIIATLPLPPIFAFDASGRTGPRANLSLEGLTFAPDGKHLWASMEAPFVQDGPLANSDHGAVVRFTLLDPSGGPIRQYAYATDRIARHPADRLADNGVSEILTLDAGHLLVLERSGVQQADGDFQFHIGLYLATLAGADEIQDMPSLKDHSVRSMHKRLLLNFDTVPGLDAGNLEGMSWGPVLDNGQRTLLLICDNNFSSHSTNIVLFAVTL